MATLAATAPRPVLILSGFAFPVLLLVFCSSDTWHSFGRTIIRFTRLRIKAASTSKTKIADSLLAKESEMKRSVVEWIKLLRNRRDRERAGRSRKKRILFRRLLAEKLTVREAVGSMLLSHPGMSLLGPMLEGEDLPGIEDV
jgi:hypothetical protein